MNVSIKYATQKDYKFLKNNEHDIDQERLRNKIKEKEIIIVTDNTKPIGWLRFGLFWDCVPIMYMLMLKKEYRKKGIGTKLVNFWENEMKKQKFNLVITTTQDNEEAQHFYKKIGYKNVGAISDINEDGSNELFLIKKL